MTDLAVLVATVKTTMLEIAKQSQGLGDGLQNAAPGGGKPNNSIQYLFQISGALNKIAEACDKLNAENNPEKMSLKPD